MVLLDISNDYGYVLVVAASTVFVNFWHGVQTGKARKASGIGYPNTYATAEQAEKDPAAFKLNCAQRSHANFTENLTPYLASLLIAGTRFPVPAAVMGAGWLASRVVYAVGYTRNGPSGRLAGSAGHNLLGFGLGLTACYTGVQMVRGL
ncbi:MAPEG family protein [Diaporthe helianthi]|uniref:MAPEG family protein n=1 Tax=Diaporthe helianthi TaxID=158607 RepID=A0A2P5I555_DIAHE|nr:MAPEG family protein [Diaporthe helianthi]